MPCLCHKDLPCPIHKDKPLPQPDVAEHHLYVLRVFRTRKSGKFHFTIAKDGIRFFESLPFDDKAQITAKINQLIQ